MGEARETRLDHVFGAVADPTRRAILGRLGKSPARVTDIAKDFPISLNSVSKHLQVLERAGLVRREIRGREHLCTLNAQPLREASGWLEEVRTFWVARLDALERHLAAKRNPR
jgi:DNA-binding transcriptional ArsR family regulator